MPADSAYVLLHSLADNGIYFEGEMSGLVALCDVLKTNSSLRELKYVLLAPCPCPCACFLLSAVNTL